MLLSPVWLAAEYSASEIVMEASASSDISLPFSDYSFGSDTLELPEVGISVDLVKECYGVLASPRQVLVHAVVEYMPEMALG